MKTPPLKQRQTTIIEEVRDRMHTDKRFVPFIRIRGRWLEAAGFKTGDVVQINIEDQKLTLTPIPSAQVMA
jgi:hypothetical protein